MYSVYILLCSDNSLYTGIAKKLESRLKVHRSGKGSKYVRARLPFRLIYEEKASNKIIAAKREAEIKSWTRKDKIETLGLIL
jgi:putative endonuclease